ncbi:MAG: membrane protein insertion efficiency factor YidD [Candidatus Auribacterota bacterium]|nr:membrane protein insertion efficiency factor YidD [Candidatus Auribacterota bacterium]
MICLIRNIFTRVVIAVIRLYRVLFAWKQPCCRYLPTCSQYALTAVQKRGVIIGCWLTVRRLLRCHPWGGYGYDPVPDAPTHSHHPLTKG